MHDWFYFTFKMNMHTCIRLVSTKVVSTDGLWIFQSCCSSTGVFRSHASHIMFMWRTAMFVLRVQRQNNAYTTEAWLFAACKSRAWRTRFHPVACMQSWESQKSHHVQICMCKCVETFLPNIRRLEGRFQSANCGFQHQTIISVSDMNVSACLFINIVSVKHPLLHTFGIERQVYVLLLQVERR